MCPHSLHKDNKVDTSKREVLRKMSPLLSRNKGRSPSSWQVTKACVAEFPGAGGGFVLNPALWKLEKVPRVL